MSRSKEQRKKLNTIEYDGQMVARYAEDLQRRYPRGFFWTELIIFVAIIALAFYGFIDIVFKIKGI